MPSVRVLMVSWEYPPVMYGGLGRHVHALSESLAQAGHDVVVLTQAPGGRPGSDTPATPTSPRVVRAALDPAMPDVFDDPERFIRNLQPRLVTAAHDTLDGWRPDIVHGHDWVVAEAAGQIADEWRVPLVATVHATESGLYSGHLHTPFSLWRDSVERDLASRADRTIVCSAAMRREVVQVLGADPARVVVVPNGVEPAAWRSTPQQQRAARTGLGLADEPLLVLVGRLEHEKGAQDAIEALALLPPRSPAVHLALVGDGARSDDLRRQAEARGVAQRVHQVGRLPDDEVAALVGAADVALVPSRYEPFGLVALEAMAAGTPVVVTGVGGLVDIVEDGRTGRVVGPADPEGLAAALTQLLDDPTGRRRLTEAATGVLHERFGWTPVAAATAQVYADILV